MFTEQAAHSRRHQGLRIERGKMEVQKTGRQDFKLVVDFELDKTKNLSGQGQRHTLAASPPFSAARLLAVASGSVRIWPADSTGTGVGEDSVPAMASEKDKI